MKSDFRCMNSVCTSYFYLYLSHYKDGLYYLFEFNTLNNVDFCISTKLISLRVLFDVIFSLISRFCVGDRFYLCENKILCEYDYEERLVFANMAYNPPPLSHLKRQTSIPPVS